MGVFGGLIGRFDDGEVVAVIEDVDCDLLFGICRRFKVFFCQGDVAALEEDGLRADLLNKSRKVLELSKIGGAFVLDVDIAEE